MARTPLYDRLIAAGAVMAEYQGAETASRFADPRQEYIELCTGCGIYDLGWRAKIVAAGKDRVRWLNGMISNNIRDLAPDHGDYNFVLNAQGRILGDMYAYNRGDYVLLDAARWQVPKLLETLRRYIIMDDVELTEITEKLTGLGVQGPRAREVLQDAGLHFDELEPLQVQDIAWSDIGLSVTRMPARAQGYEIWVVPEHAGQVWDALRDRGGHPAGSEALEMFRFASGVPRYGIDISERNLPQETGQEQALNFSKGCYIGQEIVERIHSRAMLHRKLTGLVVDGPPPEPGTKIQREGKDVGEITSAMVVPGSSGDRTLAMGYVRTEAHNPGTQVEIGERPGVVDTLPFSKF